MNKSIHTAPQKRLEVLLRQVRLEAGLTQVELAQRLDTSHSRISDYERGERRLDLVQLRDYCAVLGLTRSIALDYAADGIRCDSDGNIWAGARPGVQIIAPDGVTIGIIRLPENCANVCFGGAKRNRLFMAASQSLYAVYVEAQGAGIA